MPRKKFEEIKSKLKLLKISDENLADKAWRVRVPLEIFRKNVKQFGFFSTAFAVDEMMSKFYGYTVMTQYIKKNQLDLELRCGRYVVLKDFYSTVTSTAVKHQVFIHLTWF